MRNEEQFHCIHIPPLLLLKGSSISVWRMLFAQWNEFGEQLSPLLENTLTSHMTLMTIVGLSRRCVKKQYFILMVLNITFGQKEQRLHRIKRKACSII